MLNQGTQWKQDVIPPKNNVPVSSVKLREMGIKKDQMVIVNNIEELRQSPPGIIIAEAVKTVGFMQNWFKNNIYIKNVSM